MEPIKTVSTRERIIRNGIMTLMVLGFGAYSIYDGYIGYPNLNLKAAKLSMPLEHRGLARINPKVLQDAVIAADGPAFKRGDRLADLEERLGAPSWKGKVETGENVAFWFGPGGALLVTHSTSGVLTENVEWHKGKKTELDMTIQKIMGFVLTPLGLILVLRLIAMSVRGATLSDSGLQPSGRPLIPFDAMKGWDTTDYRDKGRIQLTYDSGNGDCVYTLDDYKLAAFPLIVAEICNRRGFDNPVGDKSAEVVDESAADEES